LIYIALLRGINVGGNNMMNMKQLKGTFERAGMERVTTYINSGNIVFAADGQTHQVLSARLEAAIASDFGFPIRVIVRSLPEIQAVIEALPENWSNNEQMKSDVLFLWEEVDDASVLDKLPLKPGIGTLLYVPGAVMFSVDRADVNKSGLTKLIGTKLYGYMTLRNVNTLRKIHALMLAAEAQAAADA